MVMMMMVVMVIMLVMMMMMETVTVLTLLPLGLKISTITPLLFLNKRRSSLIKVLSISVKKPP
jgi:hypothetical protein